MLRYPISALGAKDTVSDLSRFLTSDSVSDQVGTSIVTVENASDHHPAVITLAMEPPEDDHYLSAVNHDEELDRQIAIESHDLRYASTFSHF